ncbi:MAG: hypothetical protein ABFE08_18035 [Armatimonadia bacterium]
MAHAHHLQSPGASLTRRHWAIYITAAVLVASLGAAAVFGDATIIMVAPMGLALAATALLQPFAVYVVMLCMLSIVPIESSFFTLYIPNWLQAVIPALLLGTVLYNVVHRERKAFSANWADVFVVGFIVIGYLGVFREPGSVSYKFFTNQQVFPALMYFIAKWLPIDRERFRSQLRLQLFSVTLLSLIMVGQVVTGFDPVYHGFSFLGLGGLARGPMWSISDTVAYTSVWPVFFVYALATGLPALGRRRRTFWGVGLALAILATLATTERTGPVAVLAAFAIAMLHPRMGKYVMMTGLAALIIAPLWLVSPAGRHVATRMKTVKEQGAGFERIIYRDKALRYTRSPLWNPVWGTGFGRINELAGKTIPEDDWVYDYNWGEFRLRKDFASRPTHCAPVTLYAEYGYGGMLMLTLAGVMIAAGLVRTGRVARRMGGRVDTALVLAGTGALVTVLVNGVLHNTEAVVEVLILLWSFGGMVVGHPEVFVMPRRADQSQA